MIKNNWLYSCLCRTLAQLADTGATDEEIVGAFEKGGDLTIHDIATIASDCQERAYEERMKANE